MNISKFSVPIILKDKYTAASFVASFVILVIVFAMAQVNLSDSSSVLVIHSDIFRGADFFGKFGDVMGIVAISAVVWIINIFLAQEFYYKERFLSYILAFSSVIFVVLILISINAIIKLN